MSEGSNLELIKGPLHKKVKYEDDANIFYKEDKKMRSENHNKPLYVIAFARNVELRRAMVNLVSSLTIMPTLTVEAMGIPREHMVEQPI